MTGPKTGGRSLAALVLYSRNLFEDHLADRLVDILVALESILLKNDNESIASNLKQRLARLVGTSEDSRQAIIKNVGAIYKLRSGYLHHGYGIEDMDALQEFMVNVWSGFLVLILEPKIPDTRQELLNMLDARPGSSSR